MTDQELEKAFLGELIALQKSGATLDLTLRPAGVWYLLSALQLVLRHPKLDGEPRAYIVELAHDLAGRLGKGRPAMAEVAKRGFDTRYDYAEAADGRDAADPPAASPPARPPKRKPERTEQNKQIDPENKRAKRK